MSAVGLILAKRLSVAIALEEIFKMKEKLIEAIHNACIEKGADLSYREIVEVIDEVYKCPEDCFGASMNDCEECGR